MLRYLCLVTAIANAGGNVLILLFYRPIYDLLEVPHPQDLYSFAFVSGFSFTVGVLAYLIFRDPERNVNLLIVGITGKAIYCFFTFYFRTEGDLHWFYRAFGVWDGFFALVFFLLLVQVLSKDITAFNEGKILPGAGPSTRQALLLTYSLTGNGARAMQRLKAGLLASGYTVHEKTVEADEPLFHFPFSLGEFLRIMLRAIFRRPARIKPLGIRPDHPYDLIVVESQTWFIGMGAPMEAVFQDPANQGLFAGRDVATLNVCRGLWRRSQAMAIRWAQRCGATVVGARAYANPGWEPARTFSLFLFLGLRDTERPRFLRGWFLQPQWLAEADLADVEAFGAALAQRRGGQAASAAPTVAA